MSTIYNQVMQIAEKLRAEKDKNTFWEEFKASRVDPVVQRLQIQAQAAGRKQRGCFA